MSKLEHNIDLKSILKNNFGFDSFRGKQEEVIRSVIDGNDTVAIISTGGGKSLLFQLPSLILEGTMLVITPLKSLMHDQVQHARKFGIKAHKIDGDMDPSEKAEVYRDLERGLIDMLYVSPERFSVNKFQRILRKIKISTVVWDEFHTSGEWKHFRTALQRLPEQISWIQAPRLGFTATATDGLLNELIKMFGFRDPKIFKGSFDRPNLYYDVVNKKNDGINQVIEFIHEHPDESGIVYCRTRNAVEYTARCISNEGIKALPYHAGIRSNIRKDTQELFVGGKVKVIVATIAFGMGVDYGDIRWVIHRDLPKDMSGYQQEVGRGGRNGQSAHCRLLYSPDDIGKIMNMVAGHDLEQARVEDMQKLTDISNYAKRNICRRRMLLKHFGEDHTGNCGNCDVCLGKRQASLGYTGKRTLFKRG